MKIYLASGLANYKRILRLRDRLARSGFSLTFDWAQLVADNIPENKKEGSEAEYKGVLEADAVIAIMPCGRGGCFEVGVAVGNKKLVLILNDGDHHEIGFFRHLHEYFGLAQRFTDEEDLIRQLIANKLWEEDAAQYGDFYEEP